MNCPNCGRKMPDGTIECPKCVARSANLQDPTPIAPTLRAGSPLLGLALGAATAAAGAAGWLWFSATFASLQTWPAIVIGAAVGMVVRATGGPEAQVKAFIGTLCGALGIGGGVLMLLLHYQLNADEIAREAAQLHNLAYLLIGLSLARSLSAPKNIGLPQKQFGR